MTTHPLRLFLICLLIVSTVASCNSLRTRCQTLRVQRVRRLEEVE